MAQRVWVRMELFEHFALPFPSRCTGALTPTSVGQAVATLHALELPPAPALGSIARPISYEVWQRIATETFQWKELECRTFWLVLVTLHEQVLVPNERGSTFDASLLADEDYFLKEAVPLFKLVIFLYLHVDKPARSKSKTALDAFSAVYSVFLSATLMRTILRWHRDDQQPESPRTPVTPHSPGPASPHSIGLKDRSEVETQYLHFVKDHLDTLFVLLFDIQRQGTTFADILIRPEQLDLLGFLLAAGDSFVKSRYYLSSAYTKWHDGAQYASKVSKWLKKHLTLNDALYPPLGFALTPSMHFQLHGAFEANSGGDMDDSEGSIHLQRPIVLMNIAKSTVIKRADEVTAQSDVVLFACHDTFVYVLGPVRHVSVVACSNCRVVLVPNSGVLTVDRCESVKVTAVPALLRVHNCLDSVLNVYTPRRSVFSGDNRGLQIGPYNCSYPLLQAHLDAAAFAYVPQTSGHWNKFIRLAADDGGEKDAVVLQLPSTFHDVCIPVKMEGAAKPPPFVLPSEFHAVVRKMQENVEGLRALVASDELDANAKRTLELAIQAKFKEWLAASGNARQVLDLVHLEKARSV
ncbi:hypothetical protein ACHHYP_01957 [Achlya hypogyna]|uniref:C-CAP/cofactor C-like domain-containing protein n=1 Tax=Achlya hypogyna TaxID=1202772 RepID=A0A1V9ZSQ7_ACHHY|nr:hypothetical protein ACHHYP_01957 [Achlya hypogyna]